MTQEEARKALEALADENAAIMKLACIEADRRLAEAAKMKKVARAREDGNGPSEP